jgi:DNA-binding response OmpR family regulator
MSPPVNNAKAGPLVLAVDDQPKVLRFIEITLRLHGFEVATAGSGEEALEFIASREPDIVLLDVIMPGIGGLEVLRRLLAAGRPPVIAISANHGEREAALGLGAVDFIAKPFNPDDVAAAIRAVLGRGT